MISKVEFCDIKDTFTHYTNNKQQRRRRQQQQQQNDDNQSEVT